MTDTTSERPPYAAALITSLVVLLGLVATLAPTVTFWDAGEFIAATRVLGIPHPPGTPLFVLIAHVWALLVPFGEYAWRTNLLSAVLNSAAAGFFFLVVYESLGVTVAAGLRPAVEGSLRPADQRGRDWLRLLGAAAAALCGAFVFTNWQNANETEVYSIATLTIAAVGWIALRWRAARGTTRANHLLLLAIYLGGFAVGNHLLALLVGPALIAFLVVELRQHPAADPSEGRREWAETAVVAAVWVLLIGGGLGNVGLAAVGGLCYLGALYLAVRAGATTFALLSLLVAVIGASPYLFLFIRAGQNPMLNEADPSTLKALLEVVGRKQYGIRTPFDDPTILHGPDNPGRSLSLIKYQVINYLQYVNWQFGKAIASDVLRLPVTLLFATLGVAGAFAQRARDRSTFWLLLVLFLVTGPGLVAYMNFKPGFSVGWELWPSQGDHEVRERDYFFVISFIVWGLWAGMGIAAWARTLAAQGRREARPVAMAFVVLFGLVPFALNARAASRRHGADATLAADVAYNLLNSVPPYGVLFTYGDNDTFPLWWAQEVAGVRRDVTIVCLALAQTDWYLRQLRENPIRPFDEAAAPAVWKGQNPVAPNWPVHTMSNEEIDQATSQITYVKDPLTIQLGPVTHTIPGDTQLMPNDVATIRILQQNLGRRPIIWGFTSARDFAGLRGHAVQQGIAFRIESKVPDSVGAGQARPLLAPRGLGGVQLDVTLTERLVWDTYRYGYLLKRPATGLESTANSFAASLSVPFTQLAFVADQRGDSVGVIKNLERAERLAPSPELRQAIQGYQRGALTGGE